MKPVHKYLFKSKRLGFRLWISDDIEIMSAINSDEDVMEFLPGIQSEEQTMAFIERMQKQFVEEGFCYFAVDKLENNELIGFIGLSTQTFEADFTPCIDIGWRLKRQEWHNGYATEGAIRCLTFAFHELKIDRIVAIATVGNVKSQKVMNKIGMRKVKSFNHPKLADNHPLRNCVLYEIEK